MVNHRGTPITIYEIAELIGVAFPKAFTPTNVLKGYDQTRVYPYNDGIFTDNDFLQFLSLIDRMRGCNQLLGMIS